MKKYLEQLGETYSDNHIENFLKYWMGPAYPRKTNDLDCLYYDGDLNADTLVSVWTPLKWTLECLNPGVKFYKTCRGDKHFYLKKLLYNIREFLPEKDELVFKLNELACLAETYANVILLPDGKMNTHRYRCCRDQVPATLYHVFPGGKLETYFSTEEEVITWINREKLVVAFNGDVARDNIIPLVEGVSADTVFIPKTRDEIMIVLDTMIELLKKRSKLLNLRGNM